MIVISEILLLLMLSIVFLLLILFMLLLLSPPQELLYSVYWVITLFYWNAVKFYWSTKKVSKFLFGPFQISGLKTNWFTLAKLWKNFLVFAKNVSETSWKGKRTLGCLYVSICSWQCKWGIIIFLFHLGYSPFFRASVNEASFLLHFMNSEGCVQIWYTNSPRLDTWATK